MKKQPSLTRVPLSHRSPSRRHRRRRQRRIHAASHDQAHWSPVQQHPVSAFCLPGPPAVAPSVLIPGPSCVRAPKPATVPASVPVAVPSSVPAAVAASAQPRPVPGLVKPEAAWGRTPPGRHGAAVVARPRRSSANTPSRGGLACCSTRRRRMSERNKQFTYANKPRSAAAKWEGATIHSAEERPKSTVKIIAEHGLHKAWRIDAASVRSPWRDASGISNTISSYAEPLPWIADGSNPFYSLPKLILNAIQIGNKSTPALTK